jgi:NitT/TauT family transport system permease protein
MTGRFYGIVPISLFAMNAVRNINPTHLRTARVMRLSSLELTRKILIPHNIERILALTLLLVVARA